MADWKKQFADLCAKTHSDQARWWLNGFWEDGGKADADKIWEICHHFLELDLGFPVLYGGKMKEFKEGSDLDEHKSHRILEKLGETQTVAALRKRLKDLDIDNNKRMALSEYLLDKYKKTPAELVNSKQGSIDPAILKKAQDQFEAACKALDAATAAADAAAAALAEAQKTAAAAAEALAATQAAEAEVAKAVAELKAAVEALDKEQSVYDGKIKAQEDLIADPALSAMKKAKANNELAQLKAEDPMPLRKAKITQAAALKRVEKQKKIAEEATAAAAKAKAEADTAEAASAAAKAQAEASKAASEVAVKQAEAELEKLKKGGTGSPQGNLYWMEKTLIEKKKFMK